MSAAGSASKQIIVGSALFFCEILSYIVVRPLLVTMIADLINPFPTIAGLATLATQIGIYSEAAWAILVLFTLVVFIVLPAFRKEPSIYGY